MFKKSLIAVAALSALAGSAMAADVQIYGRIDTGFRYQNVDFDVAGVDDASKFEMATGNYTGNRVGIKGSEDLGTEVEGKTTTDRYYAIGATYKNGGLNLIGIVDSINEKHKANTEDPDDTLRVTFGGSYDFGVVKPYVSAAYFKDAKMKTWLSSYTSGCQGTTADAPDAWFSNYLNGDWDGYGVIIGGSAPLVGGTAHMTIGYMDAEEQNDAQNFGADLTRYTFAVGYEYPLSKRTKVYADAGYFKDEFDWGDRTIGDREPEGYQAAVGLVHYF